MSLRNKRDFREAVLQALDVTDDKDVENEYNFKSAVLEAMGVEFVPADIRDFEIYRAKLVEGIGNMSSGGGGSSDFSTAKLTIVSANQGKVGVMFYGLMSPYYTYRAEAFAFGNGDTVIPIILYQGKIFLTTEDATLTIASISGAIAYDSDDAMYTITGDCTITIS